MRAGNRIANRSSLDAGHHQDIDLIERMAADDQAALAEFYDRHSSTLYGVALKILGDAHEAENALEDAFLKVWRTATDYKHQHGSPFAWAITLVRNESIERLRKRERPAPLGGRNGSLPEIGGALETQELRARASTALGRLPKEYREALEIFFFDGLTLQEAADRLRIPEIVMNTRLRRGLILMRKLMSERHD